MADPKKRVRAQVRDQATTDMFVGSWSHFTCSDKAAEVLSSGAVLDIQYFSLADAYTVKLEPPSGPSIDCAVVRRGEKLVGEFTLTGGEDYYYEIVARSNPSSISSRRAIYGYIARKTSSSLGGGLGDDLGDPGAWEADEEGGGGKGGG